MTRKVHIVKKKDADKDTFGTNPKDPWSAKYNVNEGWTLNNYLKSLGINPSFIAPEKKISYAKSKEYLKWARDHQNEEVNLDEAGGLSNYLKSKGINPLFLSTSTKISHAKSKEYLKWARDHKSEEIQMEDNAKSVISHKLAKPAVKPGIAGSGKKQKSTIGKDTSGITTSPTKDKEQSMNQKANSLRPIGTVKTPSGKVNEDNLVKESRMSEMDSHIDHELDKHASRHGSEYVANHMPHFAKKIAATISKAHNIPHGEAYKLIKDKYSITESRGHKVLATWFKNQELLKQPVKPKEPEKETGKKKEGSQMTALTPEDVGDPMAATQSPADGANGGNEISAKKNGLSKSARMIKAIYKHHRVTEDKNSEDPWEKDHTDGYSQALYGQKNKNPHPKGSKEHKGFEDDYNLGLSDRRTHWEEYVKEDMFDYEKEDKSVQTYGKKPKHEKTEKDDNFGDKKPTARAIISGGTTLTGEKRDTIEIDPLMRNRPGQPDITKDKDKKDKKDDKKQDKKLDK